MQPNAVRAVSKMNLLLSLLLASRAGAVGRREGRANDNALVEPGPHEYAPKDGSKLMLPLDAERRSPKKKTGKKTTKPGSCVQPVLSCKEVRGWGRVTNGVLWKSKATGRHCNHYFWKVESVKGGRRTETFFKCRNSAVKWEQYSAGEIVRWPCQDTNIGKVGKKRKRKPCPGSIKSSETRNNLDAKWQEMLVKLPAIYDDEDDSAEATAGPNVDKSGDDTHYAKDVVHDVDTFDNPYHDDYPTDDEDDSSLDVAYALPAAATTHTTTYHVMDSDDEVTDEDDEPELQAPPLLRPLLSAEESAAVQREMEAALDVKIKTRRYPKGLPVAPAVDAAGNPMTMKQVIVAYGEAASKDEHSKLYLWDHATRGFNRKNYELQTYQKLDALVGKFGVRYGPESLRGGISAVLLYTMEHAFGGTYRVLNGLLGQNSVNVAAQLKLYNADPKRGMALKENWEPYTYWLHVFRMVYHTVAEMQLRNAQIAIYKRHPQLQNQQLQRWRSGYPWRVFEPSRELRAVWSSPELDRSHLATPERLYRGICVVPSADPPHQFSRDFYGEDFDYPRTIVYRGFTSTSRNLKQALDKNFIECEAPKVPMLLIIDPKDATPCYLDKSMSGHSNEAEYLFRPHTNFVMDEPSRPYKFKGIDEPITCISLSYRRSGASDHIRMIRSVRKSSESLARMVHSLGAAAAKDPADSAAAEDPLKKRREQLKKIHQESMQKWHAQQHQQKKSYHKKSYS